MLKNYIKLAFKVCLRRKFFTFISLFAITFTLMVLMVVTALFDHIFGQFPPEVHQDRTLGVFSLLMTGENSSWHGLPGYKFLDRYTRNLPMVEQTSFFTGPDNQASSYWNGEKIRSYLKRTDGEYWQILRFQFLEGSPYTLEDVKNARLVAVINQATRRKFFGRQPALGRTIEVDGQRFRIVGVVANVPILRIVPFADIWVPITTAKSDSYKSDIMGSFMGIYLARSPSDFKAIRDEFHSRLPGVEIPNPKVYNKIQGEMQTYFEAVSNDILGSRSIESHAGQLLGIIIAGMILFMVLPAVNLININVSRILERASEIGVRRAFGATSGTLVGQFITENVALAIVGGLLAIPGSYFVLRGLTASGLIRYADFHLNYRIFGYGLLLSLFFGLFSGVYPAWKMSRLHPVQALKGGSR